MGLSAVLRLLACLLLAYEGHCGFLDDEKNLRTDLFSNYSMATRPVWKTDISLTGTIGSLNHLNIASQSMSVNIMFVLIWNDARLSWNPANYGGIKFMVAPPEEIWTPPIVIENAVVDVGVIGGANRDATPIRISSTGTVAWYIPQEVTTNCEMHIAKYPFDTQICSIILIGWTYPLSEMNISSSYVDTITLYTKHGEFDLQETRSFYEDLDNPYENETYRKVHLEFTFRRKWQFYGQNLLMPIVLNSILMNAVFALPIESGEKMGYSLTVLLSYIVFLTWVTENLPPVSTDTSILQVYLAVVLTLGCLATLLTTWVLHVYHRPESQRVHRQYRRFAATVLLPFYRRLHCKAQGQGDDEVTEMDATEKGGNLVMPAPPRAISAMSHNKINAMNHQSKLAFVSMDGTADPFHTFDKHDKNVADEDDEEGMGKYTWQDIAVLMDYFFLWLFGSSLLLLTTVILSLLYSGY